MKPTLGDRTFFGGLALGTAATLVLLALLLRPAPMPHKPDARAAATAVRSEEGPSPGYAALLALHGPDLAADRVPSPEPRRSASPGVIAAAPAPREKEPPHAGSAIDAVIAANGGRVPATGRELYDALERLGDFAHLSVPFSAVALDSGLSHPRVVIARRPPPSPDPRARPTDRPDPLPGTPADRPDLEGRVFLAANTTSDGPDDRLRVRTVEFISWNGRRGRFDFGVIENLGGTPELKVLDGARCFSCHKNRGPILGAFPWSNTANNDVVREASERLFTFDEWKGRRTVFGLPNPAVRDDIDGVRPLTPAAADVDAAVRLGADLPRDRALFRTLNRSVIGRRAFVLLLVAIAEPGPLAANDAAAAAAIDGSDMSQFLYAAAKVRRATAPSQLVDFSPSGSMGLAPRPGGWGGVSWGGSAEEVTLYDAARQRGNHGLTAAHVPSNPKAFARPPAWSGRASELVGAGRLARTIGLTAGDRRFLAEALAAAAGGARVGTAALAWRVFSGPAFADVLAGGELPDRDDFKDRFVAGLAGLLGARGPVAELLARRDRYTSGPRRGPYDRSAEEVEPVPTTACLRCHDVRGPGKPPAFSPIPPLAFDPFDVAGREAWLRTADRGRKEAVLGRMLRRLATDRDMPPEDSAEYAMFRAKDPAAFDAVTEFLEAALKKAR